jgi:hypothetical protein
MKSNQIRFTLFQMIKNYCHIGYESKLFNNNNSKYMLGNYYGVSIINMNISFVSLKSSFNIIRGLFLKNGFICFVLGNKNTYFPPKTIKSSQASIIFESDWKGGTLSNWGSFLHNKLWETRVPSAVLINVMKEANFFGEAIKDYPILVLFFIDTIHDVFKFNTPVFINNKSFITIMYFYFVFYNLIIKFCILKKIKFIEVIKKKVLNTFYNIDINNK